MTNTTEETSINSIVVFYVRLDRFKYTINKGKEHVCNMERLRSLIEGLLSSEQLTELSDILHRTKSFIIFVKDGETHLKEIKPITKVIKKRKVFNMDKAEREIRRKRNGKSNEKNI